MSRLNHPKWLVLATLAATVLLTGCPANNDGSVDNTTDPRWIEQHTPPAQVALVFVHGVFGDTVGTWTNSNGTSFFDLLKQDPAIGPRVDLFAFGYPSKMIKSGSFSIQEAANRMHEHLKREKVLDYPAIVFVAHSMGGLVVLRDLLTHREVLDRVRVLVFYATPQEGAQIAAIAKVVANNPALADMLPADRNAYLQTLNDEWKSLALRPPVQCAYEKRPTKGVTIVPWSSATRFCDGAPMAVDADHIGIVKPDRAGHDSFVLLANALDTYVLNENLVAKLETPDFQIDNGEAVLTMSDPSVKRDARLVNSGGTKLGYLLKEFPDRGLYVLPGLGPGEIAAKDVQTLQFVLGFGATESEYRFVLQSEVAPDLPVTVKVPDLPAINAARQQMSAQVLMDLTAFAGNDEELQRLRQAPEGDGQVLDRLVGVVRESIAKQDPGLTEGGQWLLTAELMNAVNWPDLAGRAVQQAVRAQPDLASVGSVRQLAARTSGLAGEGQVLEHVPALGPNWEGWTLARTPFTVGENLERVSVLATRLQSVPALKVHGSSLLGDVKWVQGNRAAAIAAYSTADSIKRSPLGMKKLAVARAMQVPAGGVH